LPKLGGGGAENVLIKLANYFAGAGYATTFIVNRRGGILEKRLHPAVSVVDLRASNSLIATFRLASHLRNARPAILLAALVFANAVALAARRLSKTSTTVVISERNTTSAWLANRPWYRRGFDRLIIRMGYPMADRIIAVSHGVADDLHRVIGGSRGKIEVVYNPTLNENSWRAMSERPSHPWFSDGGTPVIVAAGSLSKQKDFTTLIEAFAQVRRKRSIRLVIFGEGDQRTALEALVRRRDLRSSVDLPGFADNVLCHFKNAALFVLSSKFEGFPNVLVEALASGVPLVSTNCPSGPAEILEGGRYGTLVPVGDPHLLADAIEHELTSAGPARSRVTHARNFAVEAAASRYLEVFRSAGARKMTSS
jgi:glycosyltransferase involved in cell wall biosynthesis